MHQVEIVTVSTRDSFDELEKSIDKRKIDRLKGKRLDMFVASDVSDAPRIFASLKFSWRFFNKKSNFSEINVKTKQDREIFRLKWL